MNEGELEHEVTIFFKYGKQDLSALHSLVEKIDKALSKSLVGELDGHEIAADLSDGYLYLYGPNAEALLHAVRQVLLTSDFMNGATARLRFEDGTDNPLEYELTI
jgi:hypothetical protein